MPGSTRASSADPAGSARLLATLRGSARAALLSAWTVVGLVGIALAAVVGRGKETGRRIQRETLHLWARGALRILGVRVIVEGRPPREGPFLLVANHLGYLDVITLASLVRAGFVAKREVRGWPVWGALARSAGTIFVDRTRRRDAARTAAEMETRFAAGESLILFPEGTSTDGGRVAPFRPALLESAVASGVPVYHASVAYATEPGDPPARTAVCWWGDMTFGPHFWGLLKLRGIVARIRFGAEVVREPNRKRLAEMVHARVVKGREGW